MAKDTDCLNVLPQILNVPVGTTVGLFVGATAGQMDIQFVNRTAAASLLLLQSNAGSTMSGATLFALSTTFAFSVDISTVYRLQGPASFYLAASGATATVHLIRGLSSGY